MLQHALLSFRRADVGIGPYNVPSKDGCRGRNCSHRLEIRNKRTRFLRNLSFLSISMCIFCKYIYNYK